MEKYTVNGHEIEYDTFDLDNMESYDREARKLESAAKQISTSGDNYIDALRDTAHSMLDFFDEVVGDGTAKQLFGDRVNIRDILSGYREFTTAVAENVKKEIPAPNREQRRHGR